MANSILTPTAVTREALRVLHQKAIFIGSINRQYDSSFAKEGAKIGDSLKIRLPNRYSVRTGANMSAQDTTETSTTLQVSTVKGVDLNFTSLDLTLSLDDFSKRIIEPAVAMLAAHVEADALNMHKDVYYTESSSVSTALNYPKTMLGRKQLMDHLAPPENRKALLNTTDNANLVVANSALFNSSPEISKQYKEGYMGQFSGLEFMESSLVPSQSRGAGASYQMNAASTANGATSIVVDTGTGAINVGETFTIAGVFEVHPESKQVTARLQKFVVTSAYAGGNGTISFSPALYYSSSGPSAALQNVSAMPADNQAITIVGTASTDYGISLLYHSDSFTFATADLVKPNGVDFAATEMCDGISMSIVRDFHIQDRTFPARLDILYGYKTIRPETAVRLCNLAG